MRLFGFQFASISVSRWVKRFIAILGLFFITDSLVLTTIGKWHLGKILPLIIGLTLLTHAIYWQSICQFFQQHPTIKKLWQTGVLLAICWLISLLLFFYDIAQNTQTKMPEQPIKAMLVLGSGYKQGQPTPVLASRLDAAAQLACQQPSAWIVLTGGIGLTETVSEASVMADYLVKQKAIHRRRLLLEEKSTSTELNIKNSLPILAQHGINLNAPIAIVTSDFHTLRAKAIAKKQGFRNVITVGSPTPLSTRYNNWLREYFAYISGWLLHEF